MEEESTDCSFGFTPCFSFSPIWEDPESRSMQSKHFKSLISCFLNIQTPFCGQKLAFPTALKKEFAFYCILFSKQAVQVLHTYVSHTERASKWALWSALGRWACLAGADLHDRVESFGHHSDIFSTIYKSRKEFDTFWALPLVQCLGSHP